MLFSGSRAEKLEEGHVLSTETNRIRLITQERTGEYQSIGASRFYARDEPGKVRWNDVKCIFVCMRGWIFIMTFFVCILLFFPYLFIICYSCICLINAIWKFLWVQIYHNKDSLGQVCSLVITKLDFLFAYLNAEQMWWNCNLHIFLSQFPIFILLQINIHKDVISFTNGCAATKTAF